MEENLKEEEKTESIDLTSLLSSFLKDTNLKEIIDSLNTGRAEKYRLENEKSKNNLSFWNKKFIKESAVIFLILLTIITLSFFDKINASTLGTLLGSVIGYSIGNSNKESK